MTAQTTFRVVVLVSGTGSNLQALLDACAAQSPALLIAGASLYQAFGQGASPPWTSWYGDLVPERIRGDYFARRTKAVLATHGGALVAAGLLLQSLEPHLVFGAATRAWLPHATQGHPGAGFPPMLRSDIDRLAQAAGPSAV